ncbi:GPW/gp25 family protein [Roseivirga pacifica]|uniref:GPW/gp25 family protein n=1 Tax=Roseivirga pacifica TaxID=1267423 RepID=UPI00227C1B14|nr:GPW/gp25 family protein [Roseivirga pacifica]
MDQENSFLGVGWSFPPQFDKTNLEAQMVGYEEDIRQSLSILLSTTPGERVMHPDFGCNLNQFVHEEISESLFTHIRQVIQDSIIRYEARIDLEDLQLEYDNGLDGVLYITLVYTIRQTNSRNNMVYPFYLLEGNNISSLTQTS